MNNKLSTSSSLPTMLIITLLAGIAIVSASSYSMDEAMAFPHASIIIDPQDEHANNIQIVLGHTNEPAYGKLPGIHDGKHFLEVDLSDAATTLPIQEANITADKYYFENLKSFQNADSLEEDADAIQLNVPVTAVFGQPGTFYNRQVIDPGIYGYTIRGTINYYDVALVPFEATKFCSIPGKDLTKFDSPGWNGTFGCPQNIKSIFFPPANKYPDNYNNNYPPQYPQYGNERYGNYYQQQQQQQFLYNNNNNNYGYVNEDYKQYNNNNNYDDLRDDSRDRDDKKDDYKSDSRDDSRDRDDKKDDYKSDSRDNKKDDRNDDEYQQYDHNNKYGDQYRSEYTSDDSADYGNEYASYDKE